jgi:subtilase family serine protease
VGGTSAAPLWAGFIALANQQAAANRSPCRFSQPSHLHDWQGLSHATDLHDITLGNNSGFSAISGYDLATGWAPATASIDDLTAALGKPGFTLTTSQATLAISRAAAAQHNHGRSTERLQRYREPDGAGTAERRDRIVQPGEHNWREH